MPESLARFVGLLFSTVLAAVRSEIRTACALVVNLALAWAAMTFLPSIVAWWAVVAVIAAVDTCTAFVVLRHPTSTPQAFIGAVLAVQVMFHGAYFFVGEGPATALYRGVLLGGLQIQWVILALGAISGALHHLGLFAGSGGGAAPAAPGSRGVAKEPLR
jgi:hypothetical protein